MVMRTATPATGPATRPKGTFRAGDGDFVARFDGPVAGPKAVTPELECTARPPKTPHRALPAGDDARLPSARRPLLGTSLTISRMSAIREGDVPAGRGSRSDPVPPPRIAATAGMGRHVFVP
ncbi:MAG TPA: hypothetical protein VG674_31855 [Amycolatopsis sp.]|jgi:hypothetical protein|nr:hypothetical protein [Amycolatopsis sp.]